MAVNNLPLKKKLVYRFYEMLPGIIVWIIFGLGLFFAFLKPVFAIYFVIAFTFYWLIRAIYLAFLLFYSWSKYKKVIKIKWSEKLKTIKNWENYYHLIFLATYKERVEIVRTTLQTLVFSNYPKNKFIVVLCGEERDKENFLKIAHQIEREFGHYFFKFLITLHPKDLEGEIPGKGSNLHWAGEKAKEFIDNISPPSPGSGPSALRCSGPSAYEKIIVSSFDIDTCVHQNYFAHLTYKYLTAENPTRCSYQPIAIFNNNIWRSSALMRVVARSTTFWLLTELSRSQLYFTFSSHSMSFKALAEVGFWEKDVVSEDSRIFLQCFIHYNGDYKVVPLYVPVYMDNVSAGSFWKTIISQYKQILRWGYGAENVPYMLWFFSKNKKIPLFKKAKPLMKQFFGSCNWATVPILLVVLGNLPVFIARLNGVKDAVVYNAPFILSWLMALAMIGLFNMAILSTLLLPPKPQEKPRLAGLGMIFQWFLFPITMIIFGSIPAADGITRLMIGRYLNFRVTEKSR